MITLSVPDMSCGHCKASVEAALQPLAHSVDVDLAARQVRAETSVGADKLLAALAEIGFPASVAA